MNPTKVTRSRLNTLTDLPNIGKAGAEDLRVLGINRPEQLIGLCPYEMHKALCEKTNIAHDVCVIDVFISVTRFMAGEDPKPGWAYTSERKQTLKLKKRA